ncbi:DMT family transporter [Clostridiaceae bacterium 35-E11]
MTKDHKVLPILSGIMTSSIFGFSFLFTKEALNTVDAVDLLGFRFGIAALVLIILQQTKVIKINYKGKNIKALLVLSLFQPVLYFIFETVGVSKTSTSEAGIMIALVPVVVTCFAAIFLKEIPSKSQLFFIFTSLAGVLCIIFMKDQGKESGSFIGILYLAGAVLCAATLNILSRKLSTSFKPVEITFCMMWVGAIFFNGVAFVKHGIAGDIMGYFTSLGDRKIWVAILYLGILSSIVAFFMVNYTLSKLEASRAAIFTNLTTVISILAGVLIRKEPFSIYQFIGGCLILLGVWGTNYYGAKKEKIDQLRDIMPQ